MDKKELFALIERFEKSGLTELTWKREGEEVTLRKGLPFAAGQPNPLLQPGSVTAPLSNPAMTAAASEAPAAPPAAAPAPATELIKAPLVGTFYRSAAPDAPPFAEKGDRVEKGQTLCILEAMKLMNELLAEFDLAVVEVLAENGSMVEFGTPLFEVRRL